MRSPISGTSCASLLRMYSTSSLSNPPRPVLQLPFRIQTQVTASASFSTSSIILSGHSRWSKIKHDKGKADLRRGAEFSKISREIITAAKVDGADSHRLKAALELGKKAGMSKAAMESAVQRGLGVSREGVELQIVTVEALGPANVSLIVDCVTDNKLRTMQTIKLILKEGGATVTPTAYLFSRKGRIFYSLVTGLPEPQPTLPDVFEETFEKAMDIEGVEDAELVEPGANGEGESGGISVTTVPELANAVSKQLMETMSAKLKIEKIGVEWVGNEDTLVDEGTGQDWEKLGDLISTLQEEDDVQEVYTNIRPPKDA